MMFYSRYSDYYFYWLAKETPNRKGTAKPKIVDLCTVRLVPVTEQR